MSDIEVLPVDPDMRIVLSPTDLVLPVSIQRRIDSLWIDARRRSGDRLSDGRLFSILVVNRIARREEIIGRFVPYRYYVAQNLDPSLKAVLDVRPLAVTALVCCDDGIVIGRRSSASTDYPDTWDLLPSGGIEPDCLGPDGVVDPVSQLRKEMLEELGYDLGATDKLTPVWRLVDGAVTDLVFVVKVRCGGSELEAGFSRLGSHEHSAIDFIMAEAIPKELAQGGNRFSNASRALLRTFAIERAARPR